MMACDTAEVTHHRMTTSAGVADLFAHSSATLVFDDGEMSCADLLAGADRMLAALYTGGVRAGDRIALHRGNDRHAVQLLLAAALGELVAVAVNTRYSTAEAHDLITRSGATRVDDAVFIAADDVSAPTANADLATNRREAPFVVFTTSGTTSRPKMVLHHQSSIVDHAHDVVAGFGYRDTDTIAVVLPLCGTFGLTGLMAAVAAHARVLVTDFVVDRLVALCDTEQITAMNGSDDMFHRLMNQGADLSSLRCGGFAQFNASLTDICERADHIGATLVGLYGMSEVQALFAVRHPLATSEERARAGGHVVSPAADACIINNELCVRGPSLFAGYLAEGGAKIDDGLTSSHLYHDGTHTWFRTGDLATIDGDRSFEYLSRLGDVLRLGGYLVAPAEIIDVLCTAPGVADAQVVTVARSTGTRPVAFVISDNGHVIDEQAVIEHCAAHLARYKVPVRVVPIDAFPVTDGPNGVKIRLTDLRAHAAQLLGD